MANFADLRDCWPVTCVTAQAVNELCDLLAGFPEVPPDFTFSREQVLNGVYPEVSQEQFLMIIRLWGLGKVGAELLRYDDSMGHESRLFQLMAVHSDGVVRLVACWTKGPMLVYLAQAAANDAYLGSIRTLGVFVKKH